MEVVPPINCSEPTTSPSATVASHGFQLSLDLSYSPYKRPVAIFPVTVRQLLSCGLSNGSEQFFVRNGFCTKVRSFGLRATEMYSQTMAQFLWYLQTHQHDRQRLVVRVKRIEQPVLFLQRFVSISRITALTELMRSTLPCNFSDDHFDTSLCRSTSVKTAPNTTSARPEGFVQSRCISPDIRTVLSWRLSKLDA